MIKPNFLDSLDSFDYKIDPLHYEIDPFDQKLIKDVWREKYCIKGEMNPYQTISRAAIAIINSNIYSFEDDQLAERLNRADQIMHDLLFMPAGRILRAAGTDKSLTMMNCYVMPKIEDSIDGIADALKCAMKTCQQGGGIGMDFSTLRPRGAHLQRTDSEAAGPVTFMHLWDSMCHTMLQAGSRRGAMMAVLRCDHPDIEEFIEAKHTKGQLTNFNMSIAVTDPFMQAVEDDEEWYLTSKHTFHDKDRREELLGDEIIYKTLSARELWNKILASTYEYSEPGVIFIDRINDMNNLYYCERITTTNPCGEQALPPNGACNLGAINLSRMVLEPFTNKARIDTDLLYYVASFGVYYLNCVLQQTKFPLKEQIHESRDKRRIGLGISGLADMFCQLQRPYDSHGANMATTKVFTIIANAAYDTSLRLGDTLGAFPKFDAEKYSEGKTIKYLNDPDYIPNLSKRILNGRMYNGTLLTVAPTGTTSILYGNISSGIEPIFAHKATRKVLQADGTIKSYVSKGYALRLLEAHTNDDELDNDFLATIPYMATAENLNPIDHIRIQANAQRFVDNCISKTINCPEDIPFEDFKKIYTSAYNEGLKGCTTYRPSDVRGSILDKSDQNPKESNLLEAPSPGTEQNADRTQTKYNTLWQRPVKMYGCTYKIKWPYIESALYITINDDGKRMYEIFIASKNNPHAEWTIALTRLISSIMRLTPHTDFIYQELQQVTSVHEFATIDSQIHSSLIAYIGYIIQQHALQLRGMSGEPTNSISDKKGIITEITPIDCNFIDLCPQCKQNQLIFIEGCKKCLGCGYSKC